jgi:hypothetical protein
LNGFAKIAEAILSSFPLPICPRHFEASGPEAALGGFTAMNNRRKSFHGKNIPTVRRQENTFQVMLMSILMEVQLVQLRR